MATTTMESEKTLVQLQEEAKQAQERLAQAQETARKAEREAKDRAKREEWVTEKRQQDTIRLNILKELQAALKVKGIEATITEGRRTEERGYADWTNSFLRGDITMPGVDIINKWSGLEINIHADNAEGRTVRFPKRKDGSFNYAKIAQGIADRQKFLKDRDTRYKQEASVSTVTKQIAKRLQDKFGLSEWSNLVSAHSNVGHEDKVAVVLGRHLLTEEQAEKLITFAINELRLSFR
jgi:hypothetical protein